MSPRDGGRSFSEIQRGGAKVAGFSLEAEGELPAWWLGEFSPKDEGEAAPAAGRPESSSREEQRTLLARGAAACPTDPDIQVEEAGQLPLPEVAVDYLLPKYLLLRGTGDPKGVWLKSLSAGFLVWWRAWGLYTEGHVGATLALPFWEPFAQRYYRNPWMDFDQMRHCCEQCPGVEVVEKETNKGEKKPVVRVKKGFDCDPRLDECPAQPPSPEKKPPPWGRGPRP